jgi:hypothetical protein
VPIPFSEAEVSAASRRRLSLVPKDSSPGRDAVGEFN